MFFKQYGYTQLFLAYYNRATHMTIKNFGQKRLNENSNYRSDGSFRISYTA